MKKYSFTISILLAIVVSMLFPSYFITINGFKLKQLIIPLLQIIMFGMGTTMSIDEFKNILKMPKAIFIGLLCQFTIMPTLGYTLAKIFHFPPEIAAGIILIGCSPSGLASNVMAYLAKANVPLSITITSVATLLAPILTPTLMYFLADQYIEISVVAMMKDILMMVIVPIIIGVLMNYFLPDFVEKIKKILPIISMLGIAIIIVIITASGRNALISIGFSLIFAVFLHNLGGYLLGYWISKLAGLADKDCKTVAIEVGLQNSGLAAGLALQMGKEATVGLAAALFGPMMNTTGSLLASWCGGKAKDVD